MGVIVGVTEVAPGTNYALCAVTQAGVWVTCTLTGTTFANVTYFQPATQQMLVTQDQYAVVSLGGSSGQSSLGLLVFCLELVNSQIFLVRQCTIQGRELAARSSLIAAPDGTLWMSGYYYLFQFQILTSAAHR